MLQVKELTITHEKDLKILLEDCSFSLQRGDKAVIIGEEGNGKSTLLKWIYDPILIESYAKAVGERIFTGERLGYLPQELTAPSEMSVMDFFLDDPAFQETSPRDLARYLGQLGLDKDFCYRDQSLVTLSGGEKVKAQLLKILIQEPTVLLLDEPSNDLDMDTLEALESLILNFKGIVLFISHDEVLIERTANVVIHIEQVYQKRESRYQVARLGYREYVRTRLADFERQETLAADDQRQKKIRDEKYRKIYERVDHEQAAISRRDPSGGRLLKKKMHAVKALEHRFEREDEKMTKRPIKEEAIDFSFSELSEPIPAGKVVLDLTIDELTIPVPDSADSAAGKTVLSRNIRLFVQGPRKICILGANGVGKTTLLRQIAEILLARKDLKAVYMPQRYEDLLPMEKTPVDFLTDSIDLSKVRIIDKHATAQQRKAREDREKQGFGVTEREWRTHVRTYLGALRFTTEETDHAIRELSGGQKAKLFLLKMTLSGANVLVLDEPTRNFSPLSGPVIRRMLREFPGTIISVSHDRKYIKEVCDEIYQLTPEGLKKMD
ncbi:MAG: ABC-F family ATP-binding cassette domain-containing protein [Firmicutes bacterium]|nr:ABC-F family ATP-binding cassette domain-containing protein [Bacillota bacterium]